MRKVICLILAALLSVSLCACGAEQGDKKGDSEKNAKETVGVQFKENLEFKMGTGSEYGNYYSYGKVLGEYIMKYSDIEVDVRSTMGSKDNLLLLREGDCRLALAYSDICAYAWEGVRMFESEGKINNFRTVATLYPEALQIVTTNPDIKTVADLKGKRVGIGVPESSLYFNAVDLLNAAGITENDIIAQHLSFSDCFNDLVEGKIDAAFVVGSAPIPAVKDMLQNGAHLVSVEEETVKCLVEDKPWFSEIVLPVGTYTEQTEAVRTVALNVCLLVDAYASEEVVYYLTSVILDVYG